jgi:hypothetical protein
MNPAWHFVPQLMTSHRKIHMKIELMTAVLSSSIRLGGCKQAYTQTYFHRFISTVNPTAEDPGILVLDAIIHK